MGYTSCFELASPQSPRHSLFSSWLFHFCRQEGLGQVIYRSPTHPPISYVVSVDLKSNTASFLCQHNHSTHPLWGWAAGSKPWRQQRPASCTVPGQRRSAWTAQSSLHLTATEKTHQQSQIRLLKFWTKEKIHRQWQIRLSNFWTTEKMHQQWQMKLPKFWMTKKKQGDRSSQQLRKYINSNR